YGVCLPGRENRFAEPYATEWQPLIENLCQDIHKALENKHFVFWGHSMGAGICFEAARHLKVHYGLQPSHLLISGAGAPQVPRKSLGISQITNAQLADKIKNWGGTPQAILDNKEIMDISVRILRADLTLVEKYRFIICTFILLYYSSADPVLSCPITCFDGSNDLRDQEGWSQVTSGRYTRHVLPGGHFYFIRNPDNEKKLLHLFKESLPNH
ncbi:hypothetical protein QZH41_008355, partial [Actinostola sp. cb2023]